MTGRSARNTLLAVAAGFAAYAAILHLIGATLQFSDVLPFPGLTDIKVAYGFGMFGALIAVAAFGVAAAAFLRVPRTSRAKVLTVSAGLFAASGLAGTIAGVFNIAQGGLGSWAVTAFRYADAVGYGALTITAALVAVAVRAPHSGRVFGFSAVGLAVYYGALSAEFAFELVAYGEGGRVGADVKAGLVLGACGEAVAAAAALIAAFAFFVVAARRRAIAWAAARDGLLGTAASVFALGFLVVAIGTMILAGSVGGDGGGLGEEWLEGSWYLGLSIAAACGAAAFRLSSRATSTAAAL